MAIDVGKVIRDRMAGLTPEQRRQFARSQRAASGGHPSPVPSGFEDARAAHRDDPQRRVLLHDLYLSIGKANDAVMAGDRKGYERELNNQVTLRGRLANSVPNETLPVDLDAILHGRF